MVTEPALVVLYITKKDILLTADEYDAAMVCWFILPHNISCFLSFNMSKTGKKG